MNIQEQINIDIKEAMKARNTDKLAALRALKSAIMLEATKEGIAIVSDEVSLRLTAKLVKQRRDAAAIFIEQNRKAWIKFYNLKLEKSVGENQGKTFF